MIHRDAFYRSFDAGLASSAPADGVSRVKGRVSRYTLHTPAGDVRVWFRVNPKASGIPHHPGEFWPELIAPGHVRHSDRDDDGTISWYQYVTPPQVAAIQELRRAVAASVPARGPGGPDPLQELAELGAPIIQLVAAEAPEPRLPHTPLFYRAAEDAESWGRLFGTQLPQWIQAFAAAPETLMQYMWRVHWSEEVRRAQ